MPGSALWPASTVTATACGAAGAGIPTSGDGISRGSSGCRLKRTFRLLKSMGLLLVKNGRTNGRQTEFGPPTWRAGPAGNNTHVTPRRRGEVERTISLTMDAAPAGPSAPTV